MPILRSVTEDLNYLAWRLLFWALIPRAVLHWICSAEHVTKTV